MEDRNISRDGLIDELIELRRRVAELEAAEMKRDDFECALEESREEYRALYEKAKKEEELFRSLLNSSPDAIVIYDMRGRVKYLNPSYTEIFGWTLEEAEGKPIPYVPAWDAEATMTMIRTIVEEGKTLKSYETQRYTRDGSLVDVSLSASRCLDHEGHPAGILVVLRDVSARKRAEAQLLQMSKVFMESIDPIIIRDLDGRVVEMNEEAERVYGWTRDELIGKSIKTIIPPGRHARAGELHDRCKRGEKVRDVEAIHWTKCGETFPVLLSLSLLTNQAGEPVGIASIVQDVGDLKRTEEMLRERTIALEHSNRDLEEFASIAAHDLREPLLAVSAYVKIHEKLFRGQLGEEADRLIAMALESTQRMDAMIMNLLTYSRLGSGPPVITPTDCAQVLDHAKENLHSVIKESGARVTSDPLPTIFANEEQLVQLFQNLISNAIKFAGDRIPEIHVSAKREGDRHCFSVKDNGIGIEAAHFGRIFRIFQRIHSGPARPGSGIGLANCKKIVERLGGRIWVESEPGVGATFFFSIPDGDTGAA